MGKFQLRSRTKRRYGMLLKLLASSSSKRTALAKASDFASRDTQNESSVRSRPSSPRREHSHSEPSSGRVELIDENGGGSGVSLGKRQRAKHAE
jgi:hypothetical protein